MLSKTGSYRTNPNGTTISYDKYGRKTGSFKTDSTGKTTQYDRYAEKLEVLNRHYSSTQIKFSLCNASITPLVKSLHSRFIV